MCNHLRVIERAHPDPHELRTWRAFLEAHARVTSELDRRLRESGCGLDLREYDLLVHLAEAAALPDAGLRLRDLAARVLLNPSNVTRRLEGLAQRGLVERRPDPSDGRGVIAVLTPAGRRILRRTASVHLPDVKELVFRTPDSDLDEVGRFLEQIATSDMPATE